MYFRGLFLSASPLWGGVAVILGVRGPDKMRDRGVDQCGEPSGALPLSLWRRGMVGHFGHALVAALISESIFYDEDAGDRNGE